MTRKTYTAEIADAEDKALALAIDAGFSIAHADTLLAYSTNNAGEDDVAQDECADCIIQTMKMYLDDPTCRPELD